MYAEEWKQETGEAIEEIEVESRFNMQIVRNKTRNLRNVLHAF